MDVRVIIDPPARGDWNMAVDESLLHRPGDGPACTLRLYQWSEPTLSLGYFQRVSQRGEHPPSQSCPLVRRASGGGAILHDRELTYCFAAPVSDRLSTGLQQYYNLFHQTLATTLDRWGIDARLRLQDEQPTTGEQPFLCFLRRSTGDLIVDGHKVAGSAQRRQRSGLLQHGSILLDRSPMAPELPGINDLSGSRLSTDDLVQQWLTTLARLGWHFQLGTLSDDQRQCAGQYCAQRFANPQWSERR